MGWAGKIGRPRLQFQMSSLRAAGGRRHSRPRGLHPFPWPGVSHPRAQASCSLVETGHHVEEWDRGPTAGPRVLSFKEAAAGLSLSLPGALRRMAEPALPLVCLG